MRATLMPAVATDPQLAALLEVLIAEVRGLRADLARDRRPSRELSRADRDRLSRVLPAIAGALGSEEFVVNELFERAAVQLVLGTLTSVQVGRLLQRAVGVPIAGYVVERGAFEVGRRLWRVMATA